jgi:hypothetical protein
MSCAPRLNSEPNTTVVVVVGSDGGYLLGPSSQDQQVEPATPAWVYRPGLSCAEIQAPVTESTAERGLDYFGGVVYHHLNGQPQALDPDGTGWPCHAQYPPAEVDQILQMIRVPGQQWATPYGLRQG